MGLSRDQKRKAKLKKRAERSHKHESLAYEGTKYKTGRYAMIMFQTEVGIYESYVMCDRELLDTAVEEALEQLVLRMRQGALPPRSEGDVMDLERGAESNLVIENIRRNWEIL